MMASVSDGRGFFDLLASVATAIAVWAQQRTQEDPIADLTARVRHPWRYALSHPVRAIVRRFQR